MRVLQQRIEQSIHSGQQMKWALLQHVHKFINIARVRNQRHIRPPSHTQKAKRQSKNVIKRQRCDAIDFGDVPNTQNSWRKPSLRLQNSGNDIVVRQNSTLR